MAGRSGRGRRSGRAIPELTRREREVLVLVADGLAPKVVASRLGIRLSTYYGHWREALRKCEAPTPKEIAEAALLRVDDMGTMGNLSKGEPTR